MSAVEELSRYGWQEWNGGGMRLASDGEWVLWDELAAALAQDRAQPEDTNEIKLLTRQLAAVDIAIGFPHPDGKGRIELITEQREELLKTGELLKVAIDDYNVERKECLRLKKILLFLG